MRNKITTLILLMSCSLVSMAQVGIGTNSPNANAALDVVSTTQGMLFPRMTTAQRDAISSPAKGLTIFNTTLNCLQTNIGTSGAPNWKCITGISPLPANITLPAISPYFVASVYDQDYLPYTAPTVAASLATAQAADASNESSALDVQGSLTTGGVTLKIPYTVVTATVSLPAFSQTINVPASYTQDGIARDVTFSYSAASLAVGSGTINATLQAVGGTLNAKKLDIQTGIGNDNLGWLLAQFTCATNSSGGTANFQFRNIAAIPDRNYADAAHRMLYLPVLGADGKIWLNNNLGANYANTTKASFNPAAQASSSTNQNAYGSHYQWGRYSDGHELMNWTSASAGTYVNASTSGTSSSTTPGSSNLHGSANWYTGSNPDSLWQGVNGTNNPCPIGYRLPTNAELTALVSAASITTAANAASSTLRFSGAGFRYSVDGTLLSAGISDGAYWSSSVGGTQASLRRFESGSTSTYNGKRAAGLSVRCIKD